MIGKYFFNFFFNYRVRVACYKKVLYTGILQVYYYRNTRLYYAILENLCRTCTKREIMSSSNRLRVYNMS